MSELRPFPQIWAEALELARALDVRDIVHRPGCWEHQVDGHWAIAVNPHREPCPAGAEPARMQVDVPPGVLAVWFNGWLAGLVWLDGGGEIAVGEAANEDTLIAALQAATERAQAEARA